MRFEKCYLTKLKTKLSSNTFLPWGKASITDLLVSEYEYDLDYIDNNTLFFRTSSKSCSYLKIN